MELNGRLAGILTRKEAGPRWRKSAPKLEPAITCLREQTIRDLQGLLIESTSQFVVLLDRPDGKVLGLVTLHDLLRAPSVDVHKRHGLKKYLEKSEAPQSNAPEVKPTSPA